MSRKDFRNLIILVVILAVASDILWNVIRQSKVTSTPVVPTVVATQTATTIPTQTVNPTATRTPYPTFVPTLVPTQVPEPSGTDWKLLYDFSGGPQVTIKADCYISNLGDCIGQEVEVYLQGQQSSEVYLNGFGQEFETIWAIRLVPGNNNLTIPMAEDVGIGNMTNIDMAEFDSTGYYLSCVPNPSGEGCDCTQYNDETAIYQSPHGDSYLTTIWFWSEYSDTFFLNDMVGGKSIPIQSGDVLLLTKYDYEAWDLSVLPFYGERPTPMPSRTPQP